VEFLGIILVFGGYMLIYASVAHGGQFATEPWAGLYADAYTGDTSQSSVGSAITKAGSTMAPVVF